MTDIPNHAEVPADFPLNSALGSVSGNQAKLLLTSAADGKFYISGNTSPERWYAWQYSSKLATEMVEKCIESKAGKRSHMTEEEIILQYYQRALACGGRYGTDEQLRWTFTKVAETLAWPLPRLIAEPSAT